MTNILTRTILFLMVLFGISGISPTAHGGSREENRLTGAADLLPTQHLYFIASIPTPDKSAAESILMQMQSDLPRVEIIQRDRGTLYYRVITRCFETPTPAKQFRSELAQQSTAPFIVLIPPHYCVVASSHDTQAAAENEQKRLAENQIASSVTTVKIPIPHWQVISIDNFELREALLLTSIFQAHGVATTIEQLDPFRFSSQPLRR